MKVDRRSIYLISPHNSINNVKSFNTFMENSFTIYVKCKIDHLKLLVEKPAFIVSRNGQHAGISVVKGRDGFLYIEFDYWFKDKDGIDKLEILNYKLPKNLNDEFNEYIMLCDDINKKIDCYVNNDLIGSISYIDKTKIDYTQSFIWFGCASMITDIQNRNVGSFDFDMFIALDTLLKIDEINYLKENYETHVDYVSDILPILNKTTPNIDHIVFFINFKNHTNYKVWNLVYNGYYPQIYMEKNIYF